MRATAHGFYGKLPSRGDFVRAGLPRSFTDPWDRWLQACLVESRAALGTGWISCWFEAPIWRFGLAPGICGPDAVLGVWVPSVDRVGREFPLTIAALAPDFAGLREGAAWLATAEAAACDAVTAAREPEALAQALAPIAPAEMAAALLPDPDPATWWTEGAPHVAPVRLSLPELPTGTRFTAMLADVEETA